MVQLDIELFIGATRLVPSIYLSLRLCDCPGARGWGLSCSRFGRMICHELPGSFAVCSGSVSVARAKCSVSWETSRECFNPCSGGLGRDHGVGTNGDGSVGSCLRESTGDQRRRPGRAGCTYPLRYYRGTSARLAVGPAPGPAWRHHLEHDCLRRLCPSRGAAGVLVVGVLLAM